MASKRQRLDDAEKMKILVKEEPSSSDDLPASSNCARNSSAGESPLRDAPKKRKHTRSRRHCHTQVYPEDIDQIVCDPKVPSVPGENEPIPPDSDAEINVPQCRFCLRRVAQNNLLIIMNKHKAKAAAAFKLKVFVNDAYPFACRNCLNLLDMLLDFRQTALKAKYLLLSERTHLESDGWDDPTLMETIANCKAAVEHNRKQIDAAYDAKLELEQQIEGSKCDDEERYDAEQTELSIEPMISFEPVVFTDVEMYEETVELLDEKTIKEEEEEEEEEYEMTNEDDVDETDYQPSADDERLVKREASIEVPKTPAKRGRKPKSDKSSNKEPRIKKPVKPKKTRSTDGEKINTKSGPHLCDLCGATVCAQTSEAHRNRHLGIKPYNCPAIGCELTFHSRHNQQLHVRRAHGENGVPSHECNICGQFIRGPKGALKYHMKRHDTTEKNYVCQICGKGFTMPWYLTQHSITHSGEFPHKCQYCGKKFNNKWSMKTHEKNIHEKRNKVPMTQEAPQPTTSYVQYGENSF
uniref:C2H2-type domain-containing protein n=1 Tax=Culex tarsalis TaxID=7177 RepID=A0A1Q3F3X9_CULTA